MRILGLSSFYHDSAAALIEDGQILAAAEEERFSRVKHDNGFPIQAANFCLKSNNLKINDIDYVAYYEKPLLKFERILDTFVQTYPRSLKPFVKGVPEWIETKIKVEHIIRKELGYKGKILFVPHHLSHAAATFYPSSFKDAAILTADGVGEYQTTGLWFGKGNKITPLKSLSFPHSLGLLYSTFTAFLGFRVNEDEYKVMGLAAYGKPNFVKDIYKLVDLRPDGSFKLDISYFSFRESFCMWSGKFEKLFGQPRPTSAPINKRNKDLAASIQIVTEEIYFRMLNHLYELTKTPNLCLGGGVALNALANGKIYQNTPFKKVYIFGAAGDGGGAVGAALTTYHQILGRQKRTPVETLNFGYYYNDEKIEEAIKKYDLEYKKFTGENELIKTTANLLAQNKVIGWFQGKFELGPRALGARSILANPRPRFMKDRVNRVKIREQFRPFAGSVLKEHVHELFEVPEKNHSSPFMIFCFQVKDYAKEKISAIVHRDGSCRIQTVSPEDGRYYQLIKEFYKLTGVPCVLNTSFNLKGEPIVETPEQAVEDFLKTEFDYLVIGNFLISKKL